MALSWHEKNHLESFLKDYALSHNNTLISIKELREAYEEINSEASDYSNRSYFARMGNMYKNVGKGKYRIPTCYSHIDNIIKEKNLLHFINDTEILFNYDFNTNKFDKEIAYVYTYDGSKGTFTDLPNNIVNLPEWIFNYPELLGTNFFTFNKEDTCPKGYINYLKENNLKLSRETLTNFISGVSMAECSPIIKVLLRNAFDNIALKKEIFKNRDKIEFAIEHEYLENFFSQNNRRWGNNNNPIISRDTQDFIENYILLGLELDEEIIYNNLLKRYSEMLRKKEILFDENISTNILKYNDNRLAYENEDIVVIVPTTDKEFKHEADYQQNCVWAYYSPRVANNETNVVFIRKKNDIDIPYITCEVTKSGEIIQYLTRFNRELPIEDVLGKKFKTEYSIYLSSLEF